MYNRWEVSRVGFPEHFTDVKGNARQQFQLILPQPALNALDLSQALVTLTVCSKPDFQTVSHLGRSLSGNGIEAPVESVKSWFEC
ncbi:hypothetical protein BOC35_19985 [Burkholderia pseudomallei]|nr:hypothetical protein BOC35_19985 [Burkholderia pseudomallei]ARL22930.1 hypothetical protein BOC47_11450 [Burkholderia pseudomallei]ARL29239.1 hypothetical protein BOC48_07330 [Burkholderia pseudomallei]ARL73464.1 hypothetical protein BOC54_14665 [Burkholderia pseudomallei]ARL79624.1 hypothetical protein BOC55_09980 [Burkholderia pseudomallei]